MGIGQNGNGVGADFVSGVSIGGDAIRPDDDSLHLTFPHYLGCHTIANQGRSDAPLRELPRGQPGSLEKRASFVDEYVKLLPLILGREEHRQCRPIFGRCQAASVAMREHAAVVGQEFSAIPADGVAHGPVLFMNRPGLRKQVSFPKCGFLHSLQSPEQIHRRRPAGSEIGGDYVQIAAGLQAHDHAIRGRNPNRRRASHPQLLDRFPHRFHRAALNFQQLRRQASLVDQNEVAAFIADPAERFNFLGHSTYQIAFALLILIVFLPSSCGEQSEED